MTDPARRTPAVQNGACNRKVGSRLGTPGTNRRRGGHHEGHEEPEAEPARRRVRAARRGALRRQDAIASPHSDFFVSFVSFVVGSFTGFREARSARRACGGGLSVEARTA
jgi:hypothetical protein